MKTGYDSIIFNDFYNTHVIIYHNIEPYSPKMNGKAKRKNKTLYELVYAILLYAEDAPFWWGEIIQSVCCATSRILKSKE